MIAKSKQQLTKNEKKNDENDQQRLEDTNLKESENPGLIGPDSGGQSGDSQGLSRIADAADESVEELADTGQAFEADAISGIEDAADHPEKPVRTHEDFSRLPSTFIK